MINWTALVVVTGLSTLFMLIQYVVNQREYDFDLNSPLRPVNQAPPSVGSASAVDDQQGSRPSSPSGRRRRVDFRFDAISDDDDCPSYSLNTPRPLATTTAADDPTTSTGDRRSPNDAPSYAQPPNPGADCSAPRQPSVTDCYASQRDAAMHRDSDDSIGWNAGQPRAHSVSSSCGDEGVSEPCRSFGDGAGSQAFECDETQSSASEVNAMNPSVSRRCSLDGLEILTGDPCDTARPPEPELDCQEPPGSQPSSWLCRRVGQRASRLIDYVVRILAILLLLLLLLSWFLRRDRNEGPAVDDELCSSYYFGNGRP